MINTSTSQRALRRSGGGSANRSAHKLVGLVRSVRWNGRGLFTACSSDVAVMYRACKMIRPSTWKDRGHHFKGFPPYTLKAATSQKLSIGGGGGGGGGGGALMERVSDVSGSPVRAALSTHKERDTEWGGGHKRINPWPWTLITAPVHQSLY